MSRAACATRRPEATSNQNGIHVSNQIDVLRTPMYSIFDPSAHAITSKSSVCPSLANEEPTTDSSSAPSMMHSLHSPSQASCFLRHDVEANDDEDGWVLQPPKHAFSSQIRSKHARQSEGDGDDGWVLQFPRQAFSSQIRSKHGKDATQSHGGAGEDGWVLRSPREAFSSQTRSKNTRMESLAHRASRRQHSPKWSLSFRRTSARLGLFSSRTSGAVVTP